MGYQGSGHEGQGKGGRGRTSHATGRAGTDTLGPTNYLAARVAAISVSMTLPSCSDVIMYTTMKRDSCATVAHCTGCSSVLPHCAAICVTATICVTASHQCCHTARQCLTRQCVTAAHQSCRTVSRATMFPATMAHATVSHATVSTVSHATVSLRDSVSLRDAQSPNDHATRDLVLHCSSRKVAATKGKGT